MSLEDMLVDLWAHAHANNPKLAQEDVDDDYEATLREMGLDAADLADPDTSAPGDVLADVTYEDPAK